MLKKRHQVTLSNINLIFQSQINVESSKSTFELPYIYHYVKEI